VHKLAPKSEKRPARCYLSGDASAIALWQNARVARVSRIFSVAVALAACTNDPDPVATVPEPPDPRTLHAAALTLDTHVDIPLDFATDAVDPLDSDQQVNLLKMQEGGLDAAFFIVYVGQTARTPENYAQAQTDALAKFAAIHRMTDDLYPDRIGLAYRAGDVDRLVAEGKLVAAIGVENGYALGADLGMLDRYYELGARYVSLSHDGHNDLADSARPSTTLGDVPVEHDGVSDLGARAIRRLNELGIMIDISHASKQAALDAIELSAAPVIASHSSIRAVADHVRNLDDETLLALKANGGVVQVVAYGGYLKVQPAEQRAALDALAARLGLTTPVDRATLPEDLRSIYAAGVTEIDAQWPPANVQTFIDHIDYAVKLVGVDHVGISSDFGGGGGIVGWADARETPNVTNELIARGYSEEAIRKIWSGNLLRVWREVERVAEEL
jgi:membrane dipeptidase